MIGIPERLKRQRLELALAKNYFAVVVQPLACYQRLPRLPHQLVVNPLELTWR